MRNALIILGILDDSDVAWLAQVGRRVVRPAGEVVIHEGVAIETVSLLLTGRLAVSTEASGGQRIATVHPGELIGEISFLDPEPPGATVTSIESSTLLEISRDELNRKLEGDPEFASRFYRALGVCVAHRLRVLTRMTLTVSTLGGSDSESQTSDQSLDLDPHLLESLSLAGRRFEYLLERVGMR